MIEITPKIFAPNFASFLFRRVQGGNGVSRKALLIAFLIFVMLFFLALSLGQHELALRGIQERIFAAVIITLAFFCILTVIVVVSGYFFLWPNKWMCEDKAISVTKLFSQYDLDYHQIDRIVLESPHCA